MFMQQICAVVLGILFKLSDKLQNFTRYSDASVKKILNESLSEN